MQFSPADLCLTLLSRLHQPSLLECSPSNMELMISKVLVSSVAESPSSLEARPLSLCLPSALLAATAGYRQRQKSGSLRKFFGDTGWPILGQQFSNGTKVLGWLKIPFGSLLNIVWKNQE